VWRRPRDVRRIDRLAVAAKPDIGGWLRRQSVEQQRGLDERVMTQAVRGEAVHVLGTRGAWSRVRVDDQRGSAFPIGIIGWVPTSQLRWTSPGVSAYPSPLRHPTGAAVVDAARGYLGVPYLWAGMTRSGLDCSGLTYLVFRRMGIILPRDAADQSRLGRRVTRRQLRPGDLVFFGPGARGTIHHVGVYAGNGLVLHAPRAGTRVTLTKLTAWTDYWGARRLLPTV
jgi:cell wall-associated NlpC family hydrolase